MNSLAQIGNINNPFNLFTTNPNLTNADTGLVFLLTAAFRAMIVLAGLYSLLNFVLAGYQFIQAGGDSKNITKAWERIWQSVLGLVLVGGAVVLGAIISWLVFGDATLIINPRIFRP